MSIYMQTINSSEFYNTYYGHTCDHLQKLYNNIKSENRNIIYLAGDSSLDNKYWLPRGIIAPAVNGYEKILNPPIMKPDVSYHLNNYLASMDSNIKYTAINCAVEESTIAMRISENEYTNLLPQDKFIKDHITKDDILIVSLGGNDIALKPSIRTIWNIILLLYMNNIETLRSGPDYSWGMGHFITMFRDDVKKYILNVIGDKLPKKILVSMIYYPDESISACWADTTLGYLGYNKNPLELQTVIEQIFVYATSKIKIEGTEVIPIPMFRVLNGKNSNDYVQRVEPSVQGGKKLAELFLKNI